ncbi:uncharacterized protein LACBIDRAFT_299690 [Laccaria bicolor S238N-H82]|uniref:Predicted protein n=1 Tax=Laccaria bicolor (strain S238N-H82 / ATCC MYA-4686) TaxID=486041 RepID=B0DF66_LACBS|nr:uncharacterized protein LACBIDRAFT_299690 [Laccaria bicolor S238N-H82]EDR06802.1 predicted protein [Laccaria bicolor S238N-H82]|eukprot:XP_001882649.1 predicted protein [Laccaria bicolor S238N-H82]
MIQNQSDVTISTSPSVSGQYFRVDFRLPLTGRDPGVSDVGSSATRLPTLFLSFCRILIVVQ